METKSELPPGVSSPSFLYAATAFLWAFLLFWVEPLIAKMILPWFGGSASVWTTCMVFFQSSLLLGYLYAHVLVKYFSPLRQAFLHIGLLILCFLILPVAPNPSWRPPPGMDPTWRILGLLTTTVGLPFVLLSATSPLTQVWFARRWAKREPYFLFAISNLASLLALLSFPFLIEPNLPLSGQAMLWSALFFAYALICGLLIGTNCVGTAQPLPIGTKGNTAVDPFSLRKSLLLLVLSTCGSMLSLSITNHLSMNVAPIPLLWILPLAVYLITFMITFNRPSLYPRKIVTCSLPFVLAGLAWGAYHPDFAGRYQIVIISFCAGLFICCLFCHGEISRQKPLGGNLTFFYIMISLGGGLGAFLIGIISPRVFSGVYELPLSLILLALAALWVKWENGWVVRSVWVVAAIATFFVFAQNIHSDRATSQIRTRNFYSTLRVVTEQIGDDKQSRCRFLFNGSICHGAQFLDPAREMTPTMYFSRKSGVGLVMDYFSKRSKYVGLIGLGAGTLAAYGRPGDRFRYYEINPQVVQIAVDYFSFLRLSPALVNLAMGDARFSLESENPQGFDILVVDAFSGDSIPVHLLTKQSFALYSRHIKPDGVVAFHTTNRYVNLAPVVQLLAKEAGYSAIAIFNNPDKENVVEFSQWILVTRNQGLLSDPAINRNRGSIPGIPDLRIWTDDYSNLTKVFYPMKMSR